MGKSGQGVTYPEIIDEIELKTIKRVLIETSITIGFWGLILYLLITFLTFLLWLFGFNLLYSEIYLSGYAEMIGLFEKGGMITGVVIFILFGWSCYNMALIKIKGERRHNQVSICFDKDMAKFFNVDLNVLEEIKNYPSVTVALEPNGLVFYKNDV